MPDTHHFTIGPVEAIVIADSRAELSDERIRSMFPAVPPEAEAAFFAAPRGHSRNCLYFAHADQRVLIDTGSGPASGGQLLAGLTAEGIAPESITTVIITHFHGDHIDGLLTADDAPAFPNARIVTARAEYMGWIGGRRHATVDDARSNHVTHVLGPYGPRLALIEYDTEIVPGVWALDARGHTPGHMALLFDIDGAQLLHIVDSAHALGQLATPGVSPKFDMIPAQATTTRRAIFARAADEHLRVLAYHLPFPGLGRITRAATGFNWEPEPA
jgi:glyoxylase-like metal-dependent hydrolase (beta-lactamase superfamily II)